MPPAAQKSKSQREIRFDIESDDGYGVVSSKSSASSTPAVHVNFRPPTPFTVKFQSNQLPLRPMAIPIMPGSSSLMRPPLYYAPPPTTSSPFVLRQTRMPMNTARQSPTITAHRDPPPAPRLTPGDLPPEAFTHPPSPLYRPSKALSGSALRIALVGDKLADVDPKLASKPATEPSRSYMILKCISFPWVLDILNEDNEAVTIGQVIQAIREFLGADVTEEYRQLTAGQKMPGNGPVLRSQFLRGTIFVGLKGTDDDNEWIFEVSEAGAL